MAGVIINPTTDGPSSRDSEWEVVDLLCYDFYRLLAKTKILADLVSKLRALERWQIPNMADVKLSETQFQQLNSDICRFRRRFSSYNGPGNDLEEFSSILTALGECRSHSGELGNAIEMLQQEIHPTAVRNLSSVRKLLREMRSIEPEMEQWIAHIREQLKVGSLGEKHQPALTQDPKQSFASTGAEQTNAQSSNRLQEQTPPDTGQLNAQTLVPPAPGTVDLQALILQIQRLQVEVAELKAQQTHSARAVPSQQLTDPILERFLIAQRQLAQEGPSPSMMSDVASTVLPPPYALSDVGPRWKPGDGDDSVATRGI